MFPAAPAGRRGSSSCFGASPSVVTTSPSSHRRLPSSTRACPIYWRSASRLTSSSEVEPRLGSPARARCSSGARCDSRHSAGARLASICLLELAQEGRARRRVPAPARRSHRRARPCSDLGARHRPRRPSSPDAAERRLDLLRAARTGGRGAFARRCFEERGVASGVTPRRPLRGTTCSPPYRTTTGTCSKQLLGSRSRSSPTASLRRRSPRSRIDASSRALSSQRR